jgi:ribosome-associated toxin RatA of RatAB toxin-antitoxin module
MRWFLVIVGIFIFIFLVFLIWGLLQPVKHSITRSMHLKQKPETVFAVVDNSTNLPNWSSTVMQVESLPDRDGKPVARVTMRWGHMQMIMTQLDCSPPTRLVISMAKEDGPTLGTWTYQLAAENEGCRITLTEEGEMKNPFFRAIGRMRGLDANVVQTLRDLAKKFDESADVRAD